MNINGFHLVKDKLLEFPLYKGHYYDNILLYKVWFVFPLFAFLIALVCMYLIYLAINKNIDVKDKALIFVIIVSVIISGIASIHTYKGVTKPDTLHELKYEKIVKAKDITQNTKGRNGDENAKVNGITVYDVDNQLPIGIKDDSKVKITLNTQYTKAPKEISLKEYSKMSKDSKKLKGANMTVKLEPVE